MTRFDAAAIRRQFPIFDRHPTLHYLDNAATAQMPRSVLDAVIEHETASRANVLRGVHRLAEAATAAYEAARAEIAGYLGAGDPDEVVFTGGTTASINLAAHGFGNGLAPGDEVVISGLEHHSNLVPWQMLRDRRGLVLKALPVTEEGRLDLDALDRVVTRRTRLIAVTHVSNVTGAATDVARLVERARAVGARVLLDGAQAVPHGALDVAALGVDFYAFSGHKMFAPNGVGVLWARQEVLESMAPFMGGGEMIRSVSLEATTYAEPPRRFEAGTPPIAQAVGLAAAARWVRALPAEAVQAHLARLTGRLLDGLGTNPRVRIIGPKGLQARFPVVSFDIQGIHPHDLCQIMDGHGVALRGGHHCAQPLMDRFDLAGTTRASLAVYNDEADIAAFFAGLDDALGRFR
ncbi:MAG: SufS family cysteine desulfurase [Alphaproteobacteria bacterium]